MSDKTSKFPLIIGVVFILLAAVGAWWAISQAQNNGEVMVAKSNISAYSFVSDAELEALSVPLSSITGDDLTKKEFEDMNSKAVISNPVLSGQRIDKRYVLSAENASFAAVLPDERIVAANSSVTGAAIGTIQAGDVVDVTVDGGALSSPFSKVLCIATEPSGCSAILPAGVDINADDSGDSGSSSSGDQSVLLLLAVPTDEASAISGQSVTLALNPFCRVDNNGYFFSPRAAAAGEAFVCEPPDNRDASDNPDNLDGDGPAPTDGTGATGTTGTEGGS